jgi:hypothetical protein
MKNQISIQPIPAEIAIRLCVEIREENSCKWHTVAARWCWLCEKRARGDHAKMGFTRRGHNRGCPQINARFGKLYANA